MRRTDEEFIKEVYERRKKHIKKIKQRNIIISVVLPILLFGVFVGPALLPATSADKSAPPLTTVTNAPATNQSTTYPPGTVIITVQPEDENREYNIEGNETVNFIEENVWSKAAQSSPSIHDEKGDNKRSEPKGKICTFSFSITNQGFEEYKYSLYENAIYDELSCETIFLEEDEINRLKIHLKLV